MADAQLAAEAGKHFKKLGLEIRLGAKVSAAVPGKDGVTVRYSDSKGELVRCARISSSCRSRRISIAAPTTR